LGRNRHGATIFSDLIGKLDLLRAACDKCGMMVATGCIVSLRSVAAMQSLSIGSMSLQPIAQRRLHTHESSGSRLQKAASSFGGNR
jgi:hypothetical protein